MATPPIQFYPSLCNQLLLKVQGLDPSLSSDQLAEKVHTAAIHLINHLIHYIPPRLPIRREEKLNHAEIDGLWQKISEVKDRYLVKTFKEIRQSLLNHGEARQIESFPSLHENVKNQPLPHLPSHDLFTDSVESCGVQLGKLEVKERPPRTNYVEQADQNLSHTLFEYKWPLCEPDPGLKENETAELFEDAKLIRTWISEHKGEVNSLAPSFWQRCRPIFSKGYLPVEFVQFKSIPPWALSFMIQRALIQPDLLGELFRNRHLETSEWPLHQKQETVEEILKIAANQRRYPVVAAILGSETKIDATLLGELLFQAIDKEDREIAQCIQNSKRGIRLPSLPLLEETLKISHLEEKVALYFSGIDSTLNPEELDLFFPFVIRYQRDDLAKQILSSSHKIAPQMLGYELWSLIGQNRFEVVDGILQSGREISPELLGTAALDLITKGEWMRVNQILTGTRPIDEEKRSQIFLRLSSGSPETRGLLISLLQSKESIDTLTLGTLFFNYKNDREIRSLILQRPNLPYSEIEKDLTSSFSESYKREEIEELVRICPVLNQDKWERWILNLISRGQAELALWVFEQKQLNSDQILKGIIKDHNLPAFELFKQYYKGPLLAEFIGFAKQWRPFSSKDLSEIEQGLYSLGKN